MIDLESIFRAAVAAEVAPLAAEVAELRRQVEAANTPAVYIDVVEAARIAGYRSTAALRMASRRHPEIAAARLGRKWDRARLLAAIAERGR